MKKTVKVNDKFQTGYKYQLTEPVGRNFHSDFKPELTPKQMLALGVFGGVYMRDCVKEFPQDWFTKAKFQKKGSYVHDPALNFFKVNASQPLSVWRKKVGFIRMIQEVGFSGIAVTTWAGGFLLKTNGRLSGGELLHGTLLNSKNTVKSAINHVVRFNAKRFCIGRMTVEKCNPIINNS